MLWRVPLATGGRDTCAGFAHRHSSRQDGVEAVGTVVGHGFDDVVRRGSTVTTSPGEGAGDAGLQSDLLDGYTQGSGNERWVAAVHTREPGGALATSHHTRTSPGAHAFPHPVRHNPWQSPLHTPGARVMLPPRATLPHSSRVNLFVQQYWAGGLILCGGLFSAGLRLGGFGGGL